MRAAIRAWAVALVASTSASAQGVLYSVYHSGETCGFTSVVGDVDGDGICDFVSICNAEAPAIEIEFRSGQDGSLIHVVEADEHMSAQACAGDVNADGVLDLIAGAFLADVVHTNDGVAQVISTADGKRLRHHVGKAAHSQFGWQVSGAVDLDQDGFDDYLVTSDHEAVAFSGATGVPLQVVPHGGGLGDIAGIDDVDGDGHDDWAFGFVGPANAGVARVLSGQTGAPLFELTGGPLQKLGHAIAGVSDVDGDGRPDVMIGLPGVNAYDEVGEARIVSGVDGQTIRSWSGNSAADRFGSAFTDVGDIDGDGVIDHLISAPRDDFAGTTAGRLFVYSGATGDVLFTRLGSKQYSILGYLVGALGDVDGDGVPDFVASHNSGLYGEEFTRVYSGHGVDFLIGSGLVGTIPWHHASSVAEIDEFFFRGVHGQKLKLEFEVQSGELRPRVAIVDVTGETVLKKLDFDPGTKKQKKSFTLKESGIYRLRIRGLKTSSGLHTGGEYQLGTGSVFKGLAGAQKVARKGKAGKVLAVELEALPGARLSGIIVAKKYNGTLPLPTLESPSGALLDLAPFAAVQPDGSITLEEVPLIELGRHHLSVPAAPSGKSKVLFDVQLEQPMGTGTIEAN